MSVFSLGSKDYSHNEASDYQFERSSNPLLSDKGSSKGGQMLPPLKSISILQKLYSSSYNYAAIDDGT